MSNRRWFQFSLRACIAATVIAGVAVGSGIHLYRRQLIATIHVINESGAAVTLFGEEGFLKGTMIEIPSRTIEDKSDCFLELKNDRAFQLSIEFQSRRVYEDIYSESETIHILPNGVVKRTKP